LEGVIHLRTADHSKALPVFLDALEAEPGNLQALAGLGKLWIERHEPSKAIGYLEKARTRFDEPELIVPASNRETVLLLLGQAYVDADRYEDAERVVLSALALPAVSPNPGARVLLGHIYRLRRNYSMASQQYRKAVELQPGNKDFHFALLRSLADAGQLEEEVVRLEELIARDSSELYNPGVGDVLLDAYQLLGRREDALDLQARKHEYFRGGLNRAP
jgi:tetratricopeptide (TPR) repeat protein